MKSSSLEARLCILVAGLFFALLLIIGYISSNEQQSVITDEKINKYQSLSNALAFAYEPLSKKADEKQYRDLTSKLMDADEDISYVVISDSDNKVLFAHVRDKAPEEYSEIVGSNSKRALDFIHEFNSGDADPKELEIHTSLDNNQHGKMLVGFSSHSTEAAWDYVKTRLIATLAITFLIGILGSILLARTVVHPINQLINAVHAVIKGDLSVRVQEVGDDEVGELARTFNLMVETLKDSHDKLIQRANTDSLTNLYNHRYFHERLAHEISRAERYHHPLSVIMLDIDHFKTLNDTHGHPFGDIVLQDVAQILLGHSRDVDVVARYGGEEFAIILPETDVKDAMTAAERLRLAVQNYSFTENDGGIVPATISLGVAQYPQHSTDREGLVMAADLAMYQSKAAGRNKTTIFSTETQCEKVEETQKLSLYLNPEDVSTMEAMAAAVDAKSHRKQGFCIDVMEHCIAVGKLMGLDELELGRLKIASLLYDVGKLSISEEILSKPGKLTDQERIIIKSHPALGYTIVQKSSGLRPVLPAILHHHERWDGTGYPNCLKGSDIPLLARIIAVVDAYHAMTSNRPYCKASTSETAMEELLRCAGTQFDPEVVETFGKVLEKSHRSIAQVA